MSVVTPRNATRWGLLLALTLALAAYARVVGGEFVFDDWFTIVRNPTIRDLGAAVAALPSWLDGGRPLTDLTFALDYALGRLDPFGYHLANVALHLATAGLVYVFTLRVLRRAGAPEERGVAVATAGMFTLHPMQSQAVSYVSQRSEVLASTLYLAALLLLLAADEARSRTRPWALGAAALATFVAALAAKPIAFTLPAAFLLLAPLAPPGAPDPSRWRRRAALAAPLLALVALVAVRTLRTIQGRPDVGFAVPAATKGSYFLTQWRVVAAYLRLLVWPSGQSVEWDLEPSPGLSDPRVLLAGLVLLALVAAAVAVLAAARRRRGEDAALLRVAGCGVLWFFLVLSVTSSFVPLADLAMEHRAYLASWGVLVAACAGARLALPRAVGASWARVATALVIAVWASLAVALHGRNAVWESDLALWRDAVAKSPQSARAHLNLGHASKRRGDLAAALGEYHAALGLAAADGELRVSILRNLGAAYLATGDTDTALETLRQALVQDPRNPEVLTNLAVALHRKREVAAAEALARSALELDRNQPEALTVLGAIRMEQDEPVAALSFLLEAARLEPDVAMRHVNVGTAFDRLGRIEEACASWARAIGLGLDAATGSRISARSRARSCR